VNAQSLEKGIINEERCKSVPHSEEVGEDKAAYLLGRSRRAGNKGRKEETPIKAGKRSVNALSSL